MNTKVDELRNFTIVLGKVELKPFTCQNPPNFMEGQKLDAISPDGSKVAEEAPIQLSSIRD